MTAVSDLRALAEKANKPNPWYEADESLTPDADDNAFIAACDPTTILALLDRLARLQALLARVEPELVPHHDAAQELADRFGLGHVGDSTLIEDIRAALGEQQEAR